MLKKPGLWMELENRCADLKFGELSIIVKIHDREPISLKVTSMTELIRDERRTMPEVAIGND